MDKAKGGKVSKEGGSQVKMSSAMAHSPHVPRVFSSNCYFPCTLKQAERLLDFFQSKLTRMDPTATKRRPWCRDKAKMCWRKALHEFLLKHLGEILKTKAVVCKSRVAFELQARIAGGAQRQPQRETRGESKYPGTCLVVRGISREEKNASYVAVILMARRGIYSQRNFVACFSTC